MEDVWIWSSGLERLGLRFFRPYPIRKYHASLKMAYKGHSFCASRGHGLMGFHATSQMVGITWGSLKTR